MRQNAALLLIVVVIAAAAVGVWAMANLSKGNQTLNISADNANNTTQVANNSANSTKKSTTKKSNSNNGNSGNNSGNGHWETCPTCGGGRFIPDPNNAHKEIVCPRCGGKGEIWVSG